MQKKEERANDVDARIDYLYASTRRRNRKGEILDSGKVCDTADVSGMHASDHCGVWGRLHLGTC